MVLEGATSDGERFGEDPSDPGRSDNNNNNNAPIRYHIKIDQMPKPVRLFPLPMNNDAMTKTVLENCKYAQGVLHRPLRQDEVDAISYHFAKSLRTVSWGMPVGITLGGLAAYRTMKTFRFPAYTPKMEADGGRFNPDKFGPIRGHVARSAWHVLRFQAYGFVGAIAGTIFFSSYATTLNAVETGSDPRLQDYINALKERAQERRSAAGPMPPAGQRNPIQSQEGQMDNQAQRAAQRLGMQDQWKRQDVQRRAADYDDMSPTGGAFMDDYRSTDANDTGLLTDDDMRARDRKQQVDADRADRVEEQSREAASRARNSPRASDENENNNNNSPFDREQSQQPSYPKGSTWERIRREAATGKQQSRSSPTNNTQTRTEQRDGATVGDAFSFSTSDEERQLAKTEAQKDFDARVERERHGGDFVDGARDWRR